MSTISASTTSTTAFKVTSDTTGTLVLQTGSTPTTAVTIDTSQNVGIGTTSPSYTLDVSGTAARFTRSGKFILINANYAATNTNADIQTDTGMALSFSPAGSERMRLDASGNLCLGSTSTRGVYKLDIRNDNSIALGGNATYFGTIGYSAATGLMSLAAESGGGINFLSGATERARIDSSGSLLVGTTTNIGNRVIQTYTSGNLANLYLNAARSSSGSEEVCRIEYTAVAPNSTQQWFIYANDTASQRFSVRSNGGIVNYQANDVNLSDRREKTNFAPAGDYLAKICAIPVQTFNYIDQNLEEDDGLTLGVVAQDVQAVAPELIMESDWSPEKDGSKMRLSIYQTDLQYALMKCIQEQQAIIETLTNRITALEAK